LSLRIFAYNVSHWLKAQYNPWVKSEPKQLRQKNENFNTHESSGSSLALKSTFSYLVLLVG